jgi:hypothetical protein
VTIAWGDSYARKPIQFIGGSKIPSTYQNGNVLGVTTAIFCLLAADRIFRGSRSRRDYLLVVATAFATVMSGSRTVAAGLAMGFAILVLRSGSFRRSLQAVVVLGLMVMATLQLLPELSSRFSLQTASNGAFTGRVTLWSDVLRTSSLHEFVLGTGGWNAAAGNPFTEGVVGAMQQVGLLGVGLLIAALLVNTRSRQLRRWRLLLIPLGVSFAVDSAYLVFPTLFIPIARMFAPIDAESESERAAEAP